MHQELNKFTYIWDMNQGGEKRGRPKQEVKNSAPPLPHELNKNKKKLNSALPLPHELGPPLLPPPDRRSVATA